jgi:RNA polymerase sigma-70 factor (ECF subfamily)
MNFDATALQRLKANDPKAVEAWYLHTFSALLQQAARFFNQRNAQLTAVHNAQLKALQNLAQFQPNTSMEAWLAVILRNELIDTYRRKQRWRILSFENHYEATYEPDFDQQLDAPLELERAEALLAHLPQKTRFVFSLYAFEELKPREIAQELSMQIQTVRWHLKTAKQTLKKYLES